ncbi:GAF domain-containing protein [bacterium]|nr:GAF domain-containing protein [bacterium]
MAALRDVVDTLIEAADTMDAGAWEQEIVQALREEIDHYDWVGFYWVVNDKLVLGAWDGPEATEHVTIEIGEGLCGLAASQQQTVLVDDVKEHDNYLACFPETRSEIVVPVMKGDRCIGEIDIDSNTPGAFTDTDRKQLERLAEIVAARHYGL